MRFVAFLVGHVTMVALTGLVRNMNHIVLGTDDTGPLGLYLGLVGLGVVVALKRWPTGCRGGIPGPSSIWLGRSSRPLWRSCSIVPFRSRSSAVRTSPYFWPNGKTPTSDEWKTLAADDFRDYRLKVSGLVENPVELSLDEIRAMGKNTQITLHHCIQGWSGIAEWGGLPMAELIKLVRPEPEARVGRSTRSAKDMMGARISTATRCRTSCTPRRCWPTRWRRRAVRDAARHAPTAAGGERARLQDGQVDPEIQFWESHKAFGGGQGGHHEGP